jgi:simple sugar transport system permease protein
MEYDIYVIVVSSLKYLLVLLVPYALTSLGIMIGGRAGTFNIAGEGMMLLGASVTFLVTYSTGGNQVLGLLTCLAVGALFGLAFGYLTITLKLNQFVVGITFFILASGLGSLLYKMFIGVTLTPPRVAVLPEIDIPGLSQIPIVGEVLFKQNAMVYITIVLAVVLHYILFKTMLGLNIRSVGENPRAADTLGINVFVVKYVTVVIGMMLMSLSGGYLLLAFTGTFTDYIVSGRGWISIALTLFGRWSPIPILLGSLLFSGVEVIVYQLQTMRVAVPYQFLLMIPFIVTMIILIWVYKRAEVPQALGRPYDREAIEE